MSRSFDLTINGQPQQITCDPSARVLDILRDSTGLIGTKEGCGIGECGACTILVDGEVFNACLLMVGQVEGRNILTVEGLAPVGELNDLQRNFLEAGAVQCGFCTPGMLLTATALLLHNPDPSAVEIREALAGNLCRCTGYTQIVEAIQATARARR
ncbi:(2Fe-2S)-binding protein [bacterium]|nr:(2Fe-2S)-binding protein [bacterium]